MKSSFVIFGCYEIPVFNLGQKVTIKKDADPKQEFEIVGFMTYASPKIVYVLSDLRFMNFEASELEAVKNETDTVP